VTHLGNRGVRFLYRDKQRSIFPIFRRQPWPRRADNRRVTPAEQGIAEMMVDLLPIPTQKPLSHDMMFGVAKTGCLRNGPATI